MLRYELDRLGWKDFEHLIKTLLKVRLGSGIEVCSSLHDGGREAFFTGALFYPTAAEKSAGPFFFQCKFVAGANAARANAGPAFLSAIDHERAQIEKRLTGDTRFTWNQAPAHYIVFTNANLSAAVIEKARGSLSLVMPGTKIHFHQGADVCAWIDLVPDITIRYPQLFSLADFNFLLRKEVNRGALQRSAIALGLARKIAGAFVATQPYHQALGKLNRHHFVVLEGPPEMGKTSIARMLALAHHRDGWEAIECSAPKEVIKLYRASRRQIFLADDCFGSTDYRPERVGQWQEQIPYILPKLNSEHALILTCRAHLWERAKPHLRSSGQTVDFPGIGEVVVNAADLSTADKARILYRHAKQAKLPDTIRASLRRAARSIVKNPHFTPERVRILIHELSSNET